MKILMVIGLAVSVMLLADYGGVLSIEKAYDQPTYQLNGSLLADFTPVADGEHVECTLNESEAALPVYDEGGKIRLGGLDFTTSLESGLEEARSMDRPVFIYLHSWSCGWCKKFEEEVLTDPEVISIVKSSFVHVAVEVNEQRELTGRFNVYGTPTMVFLNRDGVEIGRIRGFVDAETFASKLDETKEKMI
jgi:thiol:disulfide interchange protein DsbD